MFTDRWRQQPGGFCDWVSMPRRTALTSPSHPETSSDPRIASHGLTNLDVALVPMSTGTKLSSHRLREF